MVNKNLLSIMVLLLVKLLVHLTFGFTSEIGTESSNVDSSSQDSLITAEYFGFDFWTTDISFWQDVFNQMKEDSMQMNLVGTDAVKWYQIEPDQPVLGIHSYNWSAFDAAMAVVAQTNKVLEIGISPLSNWGTIVRWDEMDHSQCCQMSPPKEDADCDTVVWGMTAYQAWYNFVFNLVERYDGDGVDDAPGVNRTVINHLMLGNEPEADGHFYSNGGSVARFHRMLKTTYLAAKAANPNIVLVRGKTNPGTTFDAMTDSIILPQGEGGMLDSVKKFFSFPDQYYDIFAINFNDHYTGLEPGVRWMSAEMEANGFSKPFLIADARTTLFPRDNSKSEHVLPPRYADEFMQIIDNPEDPLYPEYKKIIQADEVRQSLHKILVAFGTGQQAISLQPVYSTLDGSVPGSRRYMWLYSGFFDPYIYETSGDLQQAREPLYFAMKQLTDLLIGAEKQVETLDLGEWIYGYKFRKEDENLIIVWNENPWGIDDKGLVQRNQQKTIDLDQHFVSDNVQIQYFVTELGDGNNPVYRIPETISGNSISIDETPLIISSASVTNIPDAKTDKPVTLSLSQNYPNPFNSSTVISYQLSAVNYVKLIIYNSFGQEICTIVNQCQPVGYYEVKWDGKDDMGNLVSSGIYFYQIQMGDNILQTKKLVLLK